MKSSLEVYAPYLDPEVLGFSKRIPLTIKSKERNLKYLLKKIALRYFPLKIVYRRKAGFMVPISQ